MTIPCIIFILVVLLSTTQCSKILIINGISARSHYNVFEPVIQELASRNHDVTVQAYHTLKQPLPNVKELKITPVEFTNNKDFMKDFFLKTLKFGPFAQMRSLAPFMKVGCDEYFNDDTSKTLLNSGIQYDLVIVDPLFSQCQMALASVVGKYIVELYTTAWYPWKQTATPTPPSYVPIPMVPFTPKMNFFERLQNAAYMFGVRYIHEYELKPTFQEAISVNLPQAGLIDDIEKKIVFALTNGDPVVDIPRPSMSNVVHCGGMHCRKANPLPKDLNDFVESSGNDGFIIFGLGSGMRSEYLESTDIQKILDVFSRLKQKIIWKFEAKLENIPKNVKIVEWMPQQNLLGHPKARLFITHSGLLSLQEAIYHGVPVIGVPFYGDQRGNIARIKDLGIGEHLDFLEMTTEGFYQVINKILNDKSYYENVKKYSRIFKDQAERPVDRAVFWIEYVLRHDGARHFRSAGEDLNFFQYFLLDVVGFLLLVTITALVVTIYLVKLALRRFCSSRKFAKDSKKKRQ